FDAGAPIRLARELTRFASVFSPRRFLASPAVSLISRFFVLSTFFHFSSFPPSLSDSLLASFVSVFADGNASLVSSAHDLSASLAVGSNSMIGIFAYWVGVGGSGRGNGMCDQKPLVGRFEEGGGRGVLAAGREHWGEGGVGDEMHVGG
ncbi:hypothetical protein BJY59DRAFT_732302, partial [Rhodotorula toruloides]